VGLLGVADGRLRAIEEPGEDGLDERALPLLERAPERIEAGNF
jgi:hypothetical protein